jgi:hypothetical protein
MELFNGRALYDLVQLRPDQQRRPHVAAMAARLETCLWDIGGIVNLIDGIAS